ncbi:hypothetical protein K438DRAFT_1998013 [Mycena galopus ATCC 62051]|nr:hypothetical protein K438DRAFT_1998013 [Mycena galopus ATCC 62051]
MSKGKRNANSSNTTQGSPTVSPTTSPPSCRSTRSNANTVPPPSAGPSASETPARSLRSRASGRATDATTPPKPTSRRKGQKKVPPPTRTKATPESEDSDPDMPNMERAPTEAELAQLCQLEAAQEDPELQAPAEPEFDFEDPTRSEGQLVDYPSDRQEAKALDADQSPSPTTTRNAVPVPPARPCDDNAQNETAPPVPLTRLRDDDMQDEMVPLVPPTQLCDDDMQDEMVPPVPPTRLRDDDMQDEAVPPVPPTHIRDDCYILYHHGLIQTSSDHFRYTPVYLCSHSDNLRPSSGHLPVSRSTPSLCRLTSGSIPDDIRTTTG